MLNFWIVKVTPMSVAQRRVVTLYSVIEYGDDKIMQYMRGRPNFRGTYMKPVTISFGR